MNIFILFSILLCTSTERKQKRRIRRSDGWGNVPNNLNPYQVTNIYGKPVTDTASGISSTNQDNGTPLRCTIL